MIYLFLIIIVIGFFIIKYYVPMYVKDENQKETLILFAGGLQIFCFLKMIPNLINKFYQIGYLTENSPKTSTLFF